MTRHALVALVAMALSGCAYVRAVSFSGDDKSAIETPQITELVLVSTAQDMGDGLSPSSWGGAVNKELNDCMTGKPGERVKPHGAGLIAIVGWGLQQGLGVIADELASRIEAIEAASQRSYGARAITVIDRDTQFPAVQQCLLLVRRDRDKKRDDSQGHGLVLILRLDKSGSDAFVVVPTYLQMHNAVALTGVGEPVALSVALTGKAARTNKDGVREVALFGTHTFTLPAVTLGDAPVKSPPPATGLLALPPAKATAIELSVAVTETGSGTPDAKKARAELEALAKALGPALTGELERLISRP